jgi:PEP-utilising enzyme, mobile domain
MGGPFLDVTRRGVRSRLWVTRLTAGDGGVLERMDFCDVVIVARELGIPAVVGGPGGNGVIKTGDLITVLCAEGDVGEVDVGTFSFEVNRIDFSQTPLHQDPDPHSGICGQVPSDYPEIEHLVRLGIDSMGLNPKSVLRTTLRVLEVEERPGALARRRRVTGGGAGEPQVGPPGLAARGGA